MAGANAIVMRAPKGGREGGLEGGLPFTQFRAELRDRSEMLRYEFIRGLATRRGCGGGVVAPNRGQIRTKPEIEGIKR